MPIPTFILSVDDILLFRTYVTFEDQTAINDFYFEVSNTVGASVSLQLMASVLDTAFAPVYIASLPALTEYWGSTLNRIRPTATPHYSYTVNQANGAIAGTMLPWQVAGVIAKQTAAPGRGGRGRVYFPFVSATFSNPNGTPNAAYTVAMNGVAALMSTPYTAVAGANTATIQPVLYNKTTHATGQVQFANPTGKFGTQKRRGMYGKANPPPSIL